MDLKIHAAGNIEDHIHLVVSIPPKLSVADCLRHLKGASAFAINHMEGSDGQFKWQADYGELTVDERSLETIMEYAARQKDHHKERTTVTSARSSRMMSKIGNYLAGCPDKFLPQDMKAIWTVPASQLREAPCWFSPNFVGQPTFTN